MKTSLYTGLVSLLARRDQEVLVMKCRLIGIMGQGRPERMNLGDRLIVLAFVAMFFL
jgi:hypothetical protein